MMAHCAPKQLTSCLPQVVPALMEAGSGKCNKVLAMLCICSCSRSCVLYFICLVEIHYHHHRHHLLMCILDPHPKVKESAKAALLDISSGKQK